ncbi:MAG: hypothetical protein IKW32_00030 [Bacteroidaceae bacterium]|nr:hypothetical protein [Bacteroidaceae bacterium]
MKRLIIFAVALVATFAVSIKMYGGYVIPTEPNYYCVYVENEGFCVVGVGVACYGVDENCNWLDDEEQNQPNP